MFVESLWWGKKSSIDNDIVYITIASKEMHQTLAIELGMRLILLGVSDQTRGLFLGGSPSGSKMMVV